MQLQNVNDRYCETWSNKYLEDILLGQGQQIIAKQENGKPNLAISLKTL